jgi:hypothetical protein
MIECECGWKIYHDDSVTSLKCGRCGTVLISGPESTESRVDRVKKNTARTARLRSWIAFFRIAGEVGLGDTVHRLKALAGKRAIKEDLRKIERVCSCETAVAIRKLNELYPY